MSQETEDSPESAIHRERLPTPSDVSDVSTFFSDDVQSSVVDLSIVPLEIEVSSVEDNITNILRPSVIASTSERSSRNESHLPPNDSERPSTSRGLNDDFIDPATTNNEEISAMRSAIDDESQRIFESFLREVRAREFKEAIFQREKSPYIEYLFTIEVEIDEFLENEERQVTDRICQYATHSWPYNHLNLERKHRLSRLRPELEKREILRRDVKYDEFLNNACTNEKDSEKLKPICAICTLDIRNDYFIPLTLHCGHVFHKRCIRKQLRKRRECPLCRSPTDSLDGFRLFFSY